MVAKEVAKAGIGATMATTKELAKREEVFREKQLVLLGKYEEKMDEILSQNKLILEKLNEISQELK